MLRETLTGKGLAVRLDYEWDIKDGIKEAWIVHRITASVDGEPVGYLKIAYVPEERYQRLCATPYLYELHSGGRLLATRHLLEGKPVERWNRDDLRRAVRDTYGWLSWEQEDELRALTEEELRARYQERVAFLNKEWKRDHREFTAWHRNKPVVDFIRVFTPEQGGERPASRSWQRQGIGTLLYEAAAVWMAEHDMMLFASQLQQPEAAAAWEALSRRYILGQLECRSAGTMKTRRYLDGRNVVLQAPQTLRAA